jgi:hypothetical protein
MAAVLKPVAIIKNLDLHICKLLTYNPISDNLFSAPAILFITYR